MQASHHGGRGDPLVLVHGIGGSWRNWRPQLPALERSHEVLAVGLLGHHRSRSFRSGVRPSIAALADGAQSSRRPSSIPCPGWVTCQWSTIRSWWPS